MYDVVYDKMKEWKTTATTQNYDGKKDGNTVMP